MPFISANVIVRPPAADPWIPELATGTRLWLDANDSDTLVLNDNQVTIWLDKSGFDNHSTNQTNPAYRPIATPNSINGLQALHFNGASRVAVPRPFDQGSFFYVIDPGADTSHIILSALGTGPYAMVASNSTQFDIDSGFGNPTYYIDGRLKAVYDRADLLVTLQNKVSICDIMHCDISGIGEQLGISHYNNFSAFQLTGKIAEIIGIAGTVSAETRARVEGYLAWKWGLVNQLSPNHPYYNEAPSTAPLPVSTPWTIQDTFTGWWLDASDDSTITTVDDNVSEWRDRSENNFDMSQSTIINRPLRVTDGVQFTATSTTVNSEQQFLQRTGIVMRQFPMECFVVADNVTTPLGAQGVFAASGSNNTNYAFISRAAVVSRISTYRQAAFSGIDWASNNRNLVYGLWETSLRIAEANAKNPVNDATASGSLGTTGTTWLGHERTASITWPANALNGTIREIILMRATGRIPLDLKFRIEGYLAWKWNTVDELASDHPYKNSSPVTVWAERVAPAIRDVQTSFDSINEATSLTYTLPTREAGDLLIAVHQTNQGTTSVNPTPVGWQFLTSVVATTQGKIALLARVATGDAADNLTAVITGSNSRQCGTMYSIQGWHGIIADGVQAAPIANSTLDPPSLSPLWSVEPSLWITGAGSRRTNMDFSWPSGYGNLVEVDNLGGVPSTSLGTAKHATASRVLTVNSENPGTWNASAAVDNPQAWTIAIRGRLP